MGNLFLLVTLLCVVKGAISAGSGRAFPIDSENYVIEKFKGINRRLEWDQTNYLVDMSGNYANCDYIGTRGFIKVGKPTPDGDSVAAYIDYTDGTNSDVDAVNAYLKKVVDRWMAEGKLFQQIIKAKRFGCSVRPGCRGEVSIGCLFSPAGYETDQEPQPSKDETKPPHLPGGQHAQAFTPEQYRITELVINNRWDQSHFLENLSGFETSCNMIGDRNWPFNEARGLASTYNLRFVGTYGYEPNRGSTPEALEKILKGLKKISHASRVGCSLIPDCIHNGQMFVVVSCLYEEI